MTFPGARYLLRFDDVCPTMDWAAWDQIEPLLLELDVRPILAVVPDNRDPHLVVAAGTERFWDRVRQWQARGWAIGLHGYHHTYVNREPGILRLNPRSEFAGLPYPEQYRKLSMGLECFKREGIRADAWVAPAHSFDGMTILALKALGLPVISDGLAFSPFLDPVGVTWVPQQFARMRPLPWGVWTFCYHINGMSPAALAAFRHSLRRLHPRMISLPEAVAMGNRRMRAADRLVGLLRQLVSTTRRLLQER
jgi:peptidoglycan/xylan/chitin deacetylase (PgdA/CDA1 family)